MQFFIFRPNLSKSRCHTLDSSRRWAMEERWREVDLAFLLDEKLNNEYAKVNNIESSNEFGREAIQSIRSIPMVLMLWKHELERDGTSNLIGLKVTFVLEMPVIIQHQRGGLLPPLGLSEAIWLVLKREYVKSFRFSVVHQWLTKRPAEQCELEYKPPTETRIQLLYSLFIWEPGVWLLTQATNERNALFLSKVSYHF